MAESYGRYQLIRKLATGGMAQVYLAKQTGIEGFEKIVVLKKILPQYSEDDEFLDMFKHEARLAARLNHPNIAAVLDFGRQAEDGTYFYAMEYVHGEDIRHVVKQARAMGRDLPLPLICRIIAGACEGLQYAHDKSDDSGQPLHIVHRDISPQNVLITFDGGVKVIDFGIAKAADSASATRSGVLKGKYSYMSPEQAEGKPLDRRSDVFALGIVFYELCTNARLFKRDTDTATLNAVLTEPFDPPSKKNANVDPELEAMILKALERDREQRYGDARSLHLAIEDYLLKKQLAASTSHLGSFMKEVYAERLKKEREIGRPLYEEFASSFDSFSEAKRREAHGASEAARMAGGALGMNIPRGPGTITDSGNQPTEPAAFGLSEPRPSNWRTVALALGLLMAIGGAVVAGLYLRTPQLEALVTTDPGGAQITLDGQKLGVTPRKLGELAPERNYRLRVEKEGFVPVERTLRLPRDARPDELQVFIRLETRAAFGTLNVSSVPPGALVMVDGQARGMAPTVVLNVPAGRPVKIGWLWPGQPEKTQEVRLAEGEVKTVSQELPGALKPVVVVKPDKPVSTGKPKAGTGFLSVDTSPPVRAFLDGVMIGVTPLDKLELEPGPHQLRLSAGHLSHEEKVEIAAGKVTPVNVKFVSRRVLFLVKPWADVYIGNEKICTTPGPAVDLYAGDYQITYVNRDLNARRTATLRVPESGEDPFPVKVTLVRGEGG